MQNTQNVQNVQNVQNTQNTQNMQSARTIDGCSQYKACWLLSTVGCFWFLLWWELGAGRGTTLDY